MSRDRRSLPTGPIRLLHVIEQITPDGCEKQLLELCRRLDRARYDIAVCYYCSGRYNLDRQFTQAGVRLTYVPKADLPPWRFFQQLRRVVREYRPDIVHTWLYSANYWGRLAAASLGYRRLVASDRGVGTRYSRAARLLEPWLRRRTLWTANSRAIAERIQRLLGIAPDRVRVLYNAVELPVRDRGQDRLEVRHELELAPDWPLVLMVARLVASKNHAMLLRVARRLAEAGSQACFLVAGHGPEESALRSSIAAWGLEQTVRLLGQRDDVPRLLNAADVFCFTSQSEGFPNGVAEAMAAGLPVVCTRFAGAEEILAGDDVGRLVERDDDAAMAAQVTTLLADADLRTRLGLAARAWTEQHLTWNRLTSDLEAVYQDWALTGPGARAMPDRRRCRPELGKE